MWSKVALMQITLLNGTKSFKFTVMAFNVASTAKNRYRPQYVSLVLQHEYLKILKSNIYLRCKMNMNLVF